MMPPFCAICDKRNADCDLIEFKKTQEQIEFEKTRPKGGVGHPANLVWFCKQHGAIAQKYENLTKGEAFVKIKEELGQA